jgi:DNA/RNA endonuclease YhcR with UshA esterase domain
MILSWLLTLWIWGVGSEPSLAFPRTCWIDQARQHPNGAEVVVSGTVTVASGVFGSSNSDQGFVIQDVTGGIYVTADEPLNIAVGQTLEVTGTLTDDGHGQRMLKVDAWQLSDRSRAPVIPRVASVKVAGSQLDGQLVTVQGEIIHPLQDDAPYGDRLWIQDSTGQIQVYIPKSTQIAPAELAFLKPGQHIQITGISSQYDSSDEVIPRSRADIQPIGQKS